MNLSPNNLTPGTAIESQAKGHPETGTEEAGRASQVHHGNHVEPVGSNPTGCPPLSHVLALVPITQAEAKAFVNRHHRHSIPPVGSVFQVGLTADGETICGVAIVGRPVARALDTDPYTAEVLRLCTDGTPNACSKLYAACWRAARAMGYRKLITYTLQCESGSSLKAAGFAIVGEVTKRSWDTPSRPRVDKDERQERFRWEVAA